MTYEERCKTACEWCEKGCRVLPRTTVHKVYPLNASGGFKNAAVKGPLSEYLPCTAPTRDAFEAEQATRIAELSRVIGELSVIVARKVGEVTSEHALAHAISAAFDRIAELERDKSRLVRTLRQSIDNYFALKDCATQSEGLPK